MYEDSAPSGTNLDGIHSGIDRDQRAFHLLIQVILPRSGNAAGLTMVKETAHFEIILALNSIQSLKRVRDSMRALKLGYLITEGHL